MFSVKRLFKIQGSLLSRPSAASVPTVPSSPAPFASAPSAPLATSSTSRTSVTFRKRISIGVKKALSQIKKAAKHIATSTRQLLSKQRDHAVSHVATETKSVQAHPQAQLEADKETDSKAAEEQAEIDSALTRLRQYRDQLVQEAIKQEQAHHELAAPAARADQAHCDPSSIEQQHAAADTAIDYSQADTVTDNKEHSAADTVIDNKEQAQVRQEQLLVITKLPKAKVAMVPKDHPILVAMFHDRSVLADLMARITITITVRVSSF